jgi:penicillin-binding protein 2
VFNYRDPRIDVKTRIKIIFCLMLSAIVLPLVSLYRLQVVDAEKYTLLSDRNRIRLSPLLPKRGRIITSDGKTVAGNNSRYRLIADRCSGKILAENVRLLDACINLSEEDKARIFGSDKNPLIVIKDELSWDEYSRLSMILFRLNGVSVEIAYGRDYKMPLEFCHVLGYVSRSGSNVRTPTGKTGIEAVFNAKLSGETGTVQTEVNAVGKKIRVTDSRDPKDGEDVVLTIDSELQKYVCDLLSREKAGACVVLGIPDGEVLAMVSVPAFDPNLISGRMTRARWEAVIKDPLFPLMNRAVECSYPPGSIFKIIVAFAALSEGIISPNDQIFCSGGVKLDDRVFHCWNRSGHGRMNLRDALKFSCDCYFFETAKKVGIDRIVKYAKKFGFGSETGIELPGENAGLLPSKKWKFLKYGAFWKPYETMIIGIGQGAILATLLQSAVMMGKLYSGDYDFSPTLIRGVSKNRAENPVNRECADIIKKALYRVCTEGTAAGSCHTSYGISGKTGSSQVRQIKTGEAGINSKLIPWKYRDHAFFTGCAPRENPKYVVAVMIEHGGGGASAAAPVARQIFDKLMAK